MTEVSDAPSVRESQSASPGGQGGFICYELMTTEPAAAASFYAAVIKGWKFGDRVPTDVDYRMIQRSDGGNAGGVLALSDEPRSARLSAKSK